MANFNKKTLALAVVSAIAVSGVASASTVSVPIPSQPTAPTDTYAWELMALSTNVVGASQYGIKVTPGLGLPGRSTGFHVEMELINNPKNVQFHSSTIAPTAGTQFQGAWTTGGSFTVTPNALQFTYVPTGTAGGWGIDPTAAGDLFSWAAGDLKLTNTHLLAPGEIVYVKLTFRDASGISEVILGTGANGAIFVADESVEVTFDPSKGHINKTIDVATCLGAVSAGGNDNVVNGFAPLVDTKRRFAPNGFVSESCLTNIPVTAVISSALDSIGASWPTGGSASAGLDPNDPDQRADIFNAGLITIDAVPNSANTWVGPNNSASPGAGTFQFDPAGVDTVDITVSGANFNHFVVAPGTLNDNIFLSDSTSCIPRQFSSDITGASITFQDVPVRNASGDQYYVCLELDPTSAYQGSGPLIAQNLSAAVSKVTYNDTRVRSGGGWTGDLLPLRYNGVVAKLQNVWAAGNGAGDVSLIRMTNNSSAACPVNLKGRDDNGVAAAGVYRTTLPAGGGIAVNSTQLATVFGTPTGAMRWQVEVVGECDGLTVSALNRASNGSISNLTPQIEGTSGRTKLWQQIP